MSTGTFILQIRPAHVSRAGRPAAAGLPFPGGGQPFEVDMDVTITLLGRATVDQPFAEFGAQIVTLGADPLSVTPVVPPEAGGQELRVRVSAPEAVTFAVGAWLDPAAYPAPVPIRDGAGAQIGVEPGPTPTCAGQYGVHGGTAREAPMPARGGSIVLRRVG